MKQILIIACIAIFLPGCQKIMEYYNTNESHERPHCRLLSVQYADDPYDSQNMIFNYYPDGKPQGISYGHPELGDNVSFEYDDKGRLLYENIEGYLGPGNRKYVYEGDNKLPVRDTLYRWYGLVYTESFTYDDNGRIIREEVRYVSAPDDYEDEVWGDRRQWEFTSTYYYDLRGNRQYSPLNAQGVRGVTAYSDKPNPYYLHRTFQLYFRDFSRNTSKYDDDKVATYNESGLPLTFKNSPYVMAYDCGEID